jgi:nucleotide-binding universal stress UspA family protein
MDDIRRILVTTDFSDTSKLALGPARTIARRFGARLLLAHVVEDALPPLVAEYMAVGVQEIVDQQLERARERLAQYAREQLSDFPDVEMVTSVGTPHVEIVRLAEDGRADLVVMAMHGRGFISHAVLGSTTERVLRRATCPVLVAREPRA